MFVYDEFVNVVASTFNAILLFMIANKASVAICVYTFDITSYDNILALELTIVIFQLVCQTYLSHQHIIYSA